MDLKKHSEGLREKGVDLDKPGGGASGRLQVEGNFLFAPVAFERYKSSGKGTPAIMFRMVVQEGEHIGKVIDVDMYLTGEMFDLGTFALCMGHPEEPFDENNDDVIERLITAYYPTIVGKVVREEYNGKHNYKVKYWSKAPADKRSQEFIDQDPQKEAFNSAVDGWNKYLEWRQKNPRKAPGSAPAGGGQNGGGRSQTSARYTSRDTTGEVHDNNDDIPF